MLHTVRRPLLCALLGAAILSQACRSSVPATPAITSDTWAVVDGRQIMRADVEKAFSRNRDTNQVLSEEETLVAQLGLLDELIVQEILVARAPALQVSVLETDVDQAYANAKADVADDVFQEELTRRTLTEADMRDSLRRELTVQKVLEKAVAEKVVVSDEDVTDFFNANQTQFNVPEDALHLAQIVVTPGPDPQAANRRGDDATTPQAAQAKVAMLMERLQAGGAFGDLARDYSEDPESAPRGGDMGLVPVSAVRQAPAALRDAVLNTEPGNARVVNEGNALRIVMVVSREEAGQRDLSTPGTRDQITQALRARREQLLRNAYLDAVRTDAEVTNYLARRLVEGSGKVP
jgi:parvulin-like peptidyl-prolyl isomerase